MKVNYKPVINNDKPSFIHFYKNKKDNKISNNKTLKILIEWTEQFGSAVQISSIEQFSFGMFYLTDYPSFENNKDEPDGQIGEVKYEWSEDCWDTETIDIYDRKLFLSLKDIFAKHGFELKNIITDRSRALGIKLNFDNDEWVEVIY